MAEDRPTDGGDPREDGRHLETQDVNLQRFAIPLSDGHIPPGSEELARIWVKENGGARFLLAPHRLASPDVFGALLCEFIADAARAYSAHLGIPEGTARVRIWHGLIAARDDPDPTEHFDSVH